MTGWWLAAYTIAMILVGAAIVLALVYALVNSDRGGGYG